MQNRSDRGDVGKRRFALARLRIVFDSTFRQESIYESGIELASPEFFALNNRAKERHSRAYAFDGVFIQHPGQAIDRALRVSRPTRTASQAASRNKSALPNPDSSPLS